MKYYIFFLLIFIGTLGCNKTVSNDIQRGRIMHLDSAQHAMVNEQIRARNAEWDAEILDPNDFPPPVINTIDELEDWLEFNDNLILAHFNSGSTKPFMAINEELMQHLVNHINLSKIGTYRLLGHTNSQGSSAKNMELSKKRAYAVWEIMVNEYGQKLDKIGANGEGETNPLNDNSTIEMRRANSRVELRRLK